MYIRNTVDSNIDLPSHDGYKYMIPPGVVAIDDSAGKHLTENIYKVETLKPEDGGAPIPPVIPASRSEWKGQYAVVERFQIPYGLIPNRKDLIQVAEKYGMDHDRVVQYMADESIENDQIVQEINAMPVPDAIRFPEPALE